MKKEDIEKKVEIISETICEKLNYNLVDVEYVKEGPYMYLKIYIDENGKLTSDDCQIFSKELNKQLDEIDLISENYFLEISSPGLNRQLKKESDIEKNIGKSIEISLYTQVKGKKLIEGVLRGLTPDILSIETEEDVIEIDRKKIAKINLAVMFDFKEED